LNQPTPSVEDKLLAWLSKHGFPFEMRLAQMLNERHFQVVQSSYYSDFETGTPREIDLTARLYDFYEPPEANAIIEAELSCAIECKAGVNPWVVFKQTKSPGGSIDRVISSPDGRRLLHRTLKSLSGSAIEAWGREAGYGVREGFAENDRAFTALMSSLKAAEAVVIAESAPLPQDDSSDTTFVYAGLALPVVAISNRLFEYSLSADGTPQMEEVPVSAVILRYPRSRSGAGKGAVVYIVTESAWSQFMDSVFEYLKLLRPGMQKLLPRKAPR
jgi:hypothetical protein